MINEISKEFYFQQMVLKLLDKQQSIISSNIANSDTPGYKAKGINFKKELIKIIKNQKSTDLKLTSKNHIQKKNNYIFDDMYLVNKKYTQNAIDKNSVDLDVERTSFVINSLKYQVGLSFINHQIKSIMSVFSK